MRNKVKKMLGLILLVLCMSLVGCGTVSSVSTVASSKPLTNASGGNGAGLFENDDFRIKVTGGLDGNYRSGAPVPINIDITSLNENFEGLVRMIVPGDRFNTEGTAYEQEILLTAGEEKHITNSVNCANGIMSLGFELENAKGKVLVQQFITLRSSTNITALVGILSDDYPSLSYMDQVSLELPSGFSDYTSLVELDADKMPDQASGLECLSYLVINSFDTSKLSKNQYDAIVRFVKSGGVLIIGTGSDYKQTLSGITDELAGGKVTSGAEADFTVYSDDANRMAEHVSYTANDGLLSLELTDGAPLHGVLGDESLIWDKPVGLGHVVVTSFNLGMEPLNSWNEKGDFVRNLFNKSASGYSADRINKINWGGSSVGYYERNLLKGLQQYKVPNMTLLYGSFAVFLLFIGIALYLILKKMDRRGLIWVLIPACSLLFSATVLLLTANVRLKHVVSGSITSVMHDQESNSASSEVRLGLMLPQNGKHTISMDPSLTGLDIIKEEDYWYGNSDDFFSYETAIRESANGYSLTLKTTSTFDSRYLSFDSAKIPEIGGFEVDIKNRTSGISGTVTNRSGRSLRNVMVLVQNYLVILGDMEADESRSFTEADNTFFDYVDDFLLTSISASPEDPDFGMLIRSSFSFLNQYGNSMAGNDIYVYGFAGDMEADYIVNSEVTESNVLQVIDRFVVPYDDFTGGFRVSLYDYTDNVINGRWDTDGQMWTNICEVDYDLRYACNTVYAMMRQSDHNPRYGSTEGVTIYAFNYKTNQYDEVFKDDSLLEEFNDSCPYFNNGHMQFKYVADASADLDYCFSPVINLIGGMIDAGN